VTVRITPLAAAAWHTIVDALSAQAGVAARLLAGDLPQDIERVFEAAKVSLFPTSYKDLRTTCSCPDDTNPCKHIAAVYYLLAEEFDRDPFLIFQLRGLTREGLTAGLLERSQADETGVHEPGPAASAPDAGRREVDAAAYWRPLAVPAEFFGDVAAPPVPQALLQRFGRFPFWRGETALLDALSPQYEAAVRRAMDFFAGLDTPAE
jgi:uncharacterized Zn finger protein